MKKISVIVPVYNTEKYISRCIDSLINQSYENLEIILVDDGSPDNCPAICDGYAEKDSRIKVFHKANGGTSSARNAGLDIAEGDYIGFADGDDCLHRDFYKILLEICEKNSCDTAQVSWIKWTDTVPEITVEDYTPEIYETDKILVKDYVSMTNIYHTSVTLKLFEKSLFDNFRFDEKMLNLEDVASKPDLMSRSERFAKTDLPLYYYYVANTEGKTQNRKNRKHFNILADIHINRVLWENNTEKKEIITQNRLFSVLYAFSKIYSYYDRKILEDSRTEILDFYRDRTKYIKSSFVRYIYSLFEKENYLLLKILCFLTFDIYKKRMKIHGKNICNCSCL